MTPEIIAFLGVLVSTSITIVGWIYTARIQHRILDENRKAQRIDRELAAFRERLSTVREIINSILEQTHLYTNLAALFVTRSFTFNEGDPIITSLVSKSKEFYKILYDPEFISIQNLLPEEKRNEIVALLNTAMSHMSDYHSSAAWLNLSDPNIASKINELANGALSINKDLFNLVKILSSTYAVLDNKLASG